MSALSLQSWEVKENQLVITWLAPISHPSQSDRETFKSHSLTQQKTTPVASFSRKFSGFHSVRNGTFFNNIFHIMNRSITETQRSELAGLKPHSKSTESKRSLQSTWSNYFSLSHYYSDLASGCHLEKVI